MNNVIYKKKKNYIVDRDIESLNISEDIIHNKGSKINIVYSNTALGKSTLSEKVLGLINDNYIKITIKTINKNNRSSFIEGEYFSLLFNALKSKFQNDTELSLDSFIRKNKNKQLQKELIYNYINQWTNTSSTINVLLSGIFYFVQKKFKLGYFDINNVMEENSVLQKKIQYYYVKSVLSQNNCIIVIENFQNIDTQSFDKLLDCISQTYKSTNYYIFEYTISEKNTYLDLENVKKLLCDYNVPIETTQLEMLDSIYLPDLVNKHFDIIEHDIDFNKKMISFYKENNNGNLRQIIDFSFEYNKNISTTDNATLKRIWQLSDLELTLLITIIYVNESFSEKELIGFWRENQVSEVSLKLMLKQLIDKQIIGVSTNNNLVLSHASIYDIWEKYRISEPMKKIDFLVYKKISEHFIILWQDENETNKSNVWDILLNMYSIHEPDKLWQLFKELHNRIFLSISPQNAWKYINSFIECTKKDYQRYIDKYIFILNVCFEFELYESAYKLLRFVEDNISLVEYPEIAIYKCMYLSALDLHKENIEFYNKVKNKPQFTEQHIFNLKLCVLSSFRSLGMKREWNILYDEISKCKAYKKYSEYGYLLRLADMYYDRTKALPMAKKSISFFKKKELKHQAGKSMITTAHLASGLGKQHLALYYINKAEKVLNNKIMGKHMLLVNKAVILLLSGKKDYQIMNLLDEAALSAVVSFDKLAIIVNKLAWMIATESYINFNSLENQGKRYITEEPDKHIHALFFYNMYYIYKRKGEKNKANHYLKETKKVMDYCLPVKERLSNISSKNNKTVLKHNFHICFLTYWTFDILL